MLLFYVNKQIKIPPGKKVWLIKLINVLQFILTPLVHLPTKYAKSDNQIQRDMFICPPRDKAAEIAKAEKTQKAILLFFSLDTGVKNLSELTCPLGAFVGRIVSSYRKKSVFYFICYLR